MIESKYDNQDKKEEKIIIINKKMQLGRFFSLTITPPFTNLELAQQYFDQSGKISRVYLILDEKKNTMSCLLHSLQMRSTNSTLNIINQKI